jgi:hypothetical protein
MNMKDISQTAAHCGLYCESCSLFIGTQSEPTRLEMLAQRYGKTADEMRCRGCRSDELSFYCATCKMKTCLKEKRLDFCSECTEYPCQILKEFQLQMPHRAELFESLDYIRDNGYDQWCVKMKTDFGCEQCGTINSIYDIKCRKCAHTPPNPFAKRNQSIIAKTLIKLQKS